MQIFADFMGYTNIAIGVALLLGFEFPQNFNSPYQAVSLQDFWRRWHMTLSRWLRDYLYIPLGGNKKGRVRTYVNLLADDAAGRPLARRRLDVRRSGAASTAPGWPSSGWPATCARAGPAVLRRGVWSRWLGRLVTFHFVCFGWIFFRASVAARRGLRDRPPLQRVGPAVAARHHRRRCSRSQSASARTFSRGASSPSPSPGSRGFPSPRRQPALAVGLMLVDTLGPQGVAPFIYFRF